MIPARDRGELEWLHWSGAAFRRARTERKPILLSVVASWADGCREMDRVCYGDPSLAAKIADHLIPVRVDADDRPDIADRYDLGGLPTTAFLSADGELLGGGTFVPPERLDAAIDRVLEKAGASPRAVDVRTDPDGREVDDSALVDFVFDSFDRAHGGFGSAPKFPLTAPVHLAIELHVDGDAAMLDAAVRTLDAMGWGALYDADEGGFFRCAAAEDWTSPEPGKLLATNIALLDLYVHAAGRLGHERWLTRAVDIIRFVESRLRGWGGAFQVAERAGFSRWFTDSNGHAVSALLRAAAALRDDELGKRALDVLEKVLLASYKPGEGVAHTVRGVRGLLVDQVAMAAANLDAWEATGNIVYRMMAEELIHYALRTMWDGEGGFLDRSVDGASDEPPLGPVKPLVANCDAALVLSRLADATGDSTFASRATEILAAMAPRAAEAGPLAAHYLLARRAVPR